MGAVNCYPAGHEKESHTGRSGRLHHVVIQVFERCRVCKEDKGRNHFPECLHSKRLMNRS